MVSDGSNMWLGGSRCSYAALDGWKAIPSTESRRRASYSCSAAIALWLLQSTAQKETKYKVD